MEKSKQSASESTAQEIVEEALEESSVNQSENAEFLNIPGMKIEMSSRTQRGIKYASTFATEANVPLDSALLLAGYLTVKKGMPEDSCKFFYDYLVEHSPSKSVGIVNLLGLTNWYGITRGVRKYSPIPPPKGIDPDVEIVLKRAVELAKHMSNRNRVAARHILLALLDDLDPTPQVQIVLQKQGYDLDELRRALIGKFFEIQKSSQVKWLADEAEKRDMLDRGALAATLADRLQKFHDDTDFKEMSFLIHIDGPWGSGKTTLINLLKSRLTAEDGSAENRSSKWLFVPFDAWRQSHVGPPWWALLTQLRQKVAEQAQKPQVLWWAELRERIQRLGPKYVMALALTLSVCFLIFLYIVLIGFNLKDIGEFVGGLTAAVGIVTAVWGGAMLISRFAFWHSAAGAKFFERSHENPMQEVARHFAWLMRYSGKTPLFLIDDLDRCPSTYVVGLLDAIQTLMRKFDEQPTSSKPRPAYFIIAADGRWIRQSYEIAYKDFAGVVDEPARPLGYLFLDKLFQLTVRVPLMSPELRVSFLKQLLEVESKGLPDGLKQQETDVRDKLKESNGEEEVVKIVREADPIVQQRVAVEVVEKLTSEKFERTTEHALQKFAPILDPNPRSMKRFIMAYSLSRTILSLEGNWVETDTLALWTILQLRWPELAEHLRKYPRDIDLDGPNTTASMSEKLRDVFVDHEVQRVVKFADGGPLTEDKIKKCCVRGRGN